MKNYYDQSNFGDRYSGYGDNDGDWLDGQTC